jgi:cytochrome oxidase Cu insertion factor (SCO1/SenC/PrrC family)
MRNSLIPELLSKLRLVGLAVALSLAVMALAACGGESPGPTPDTPQPAAADATASPTSAGEPAAATDETEPQGNLAHKFELTNARGETVSLASYAGDKNVVLVFYRGFW